MPESTRRVVNLGARVDSQRVMDGLWDIHEFLGDQQIEQRKDEMLSGAAFVKGRTVGFCFLLAGLSFGSPLNSFGLVF